MEIINTMKKSGSVRKALGKRKTNKLGNYPMRKWKEFDKQLEQLKKLYGVGSGLLGATAVGGLGYGAYKLYQHFKDKGKKEYYHGSPHKGIKELHAGSYVTPDKNTARLMGRYHLDTGKTWTDDDLAEPHYFGQEPKWKREPMGEPEIYAIKAKDKDLDKLDNPYEHKTNRSFKV